MSAMDGKTKCRHTVVQYGLIDMIDWNNNGKIDPEEIFLTEEILGEAESADSPESHPVKSEPRPSFMQKLASRFKKNKNNSQLSKSPIVPSRLPDEIPLHVGDIIHHSAFGEGIVLSISNPTRRAILEVDFGKKGTRKLMYQTAAINIAETVQKELQFEEERRAKLQQILERKPVNRRKIAADPVISLAFDTLTVFGYPFHYIQEIRPECDATGRVKECFPELEQGRRLNKNGKPPFCRFSIDADSLPGVYLWVVDGDIIYIGETENLKKRFNNGYGRIYTYNCYSGGRSTNCKMNKVVLELAKAGKYVKLYFYQTEEYKKVELELLGMINTKYNVKDN